MVCEICKKKEAIFFIKEVVFGKARNIALCEDCAMKHKETIMPSNIQIEELIKSLLEFTEEDNKKEEKKVVKKHKNKRCPNCGSTYEEVILASTCGCSECYNAFRTEIDEIVDRVSKDISYKGIIKNKKDNDMNSNNKNNKDKKSSDDDKLKIIRDYKKELNEAIKIEDYEKAAELRDIIRKLEGKETKKTVTKKTVTKKTVTKKTTKTSTRKKKEDK